jgi:hypothetical protein
MIFLRKWSPDLFGDAAVIARLRELSTIVFALSPRKAHENGSMDRGFSFGRVCENPNGQHQ